MTYGEASTERSAIGSGLIYHGIPEVSQKWCHNVVSNTSNTYVQFTSSLIHRISSESLKC